MFMFTEYLEGCVFEASVEAGECDVFNVRDECFVPWSSD